MDLGMGQSGAPGRTGGPRGAVPGGARFLILGLAAALALSVFWIDSIADFDFSVSILYLVVLVLVSLAGDRTAVVRAAGACVTLALLAWIVAHVHQPTMPNMLRCLFACIAICVTAALLVSRKRLEAAKLDLERSRLEVERFANSVPFVLWRSNPQGEIQYLNESWTTVTGLDRWSVLKDERYNDVVHPDDIPALNATVGAAVANQTITDLKVRIRQADGAYRWMQIYDRPDRSPVTGEVERYGGLSDVHEAVVAREALQQVRLELEASKAELVNFTNSVPQILWRTNTEAQIDFYNARYSELTGRDVDETIARQDYIDVYHPDDREDLVRARCEAFTNRTELRTNYRLRHADGSYRWMSLVGRPVPVADGSGDVRYYGGISDIHEEVIAHQKVRELNETLEQRVAERTSDLLRTERRYAALFDLGNMTFAELDFSATDVTLQEIRAGGVRDLRAYLRDRPDELSHILGLIRITRVNGALARMMGHEQVADLVTTPLALYGADAPPMLLKQLAMAYDGVDHIDGRTALVGKAGQRIPVYFTVTRLPDGIHLASHVDLTEQERIEEMRRAAQAELARANRVATVGAFSASIAHELNQPIASMLMDAQTGIRLVGREHPDTETLGRVLQRVEKTAQRVADIVQRTRQNIVAGRRAATAIDLCRLARETRDLLDHDLRRAGIALELACPDALPLVTGDPVELQQVFVNLLNNAADAMRQQPGPRRITLRIAPDDDAVRVWVSDTGPGIPEAILDRLFEPFFTTKATGIGMGLQICRTAVEAMGGQLTVANAPGGGASFSFDLPISPSEATGD